MVKQRIFTTVYANKGMQTKVYKDIQRYANKGIQKLFLSYQNPGDFRRL